MFYMLYENGFVTAITKQEITTNEDCENRLRYATRKQAEKEAKTNGWLDSVEIHSDNEQPIDIYNGQRNIGFLKADPKEKNLIREYADKCGMWDALNRKLDVHPVKGTGFYVAIFD